MGGAGCCNLVVVCKERRDEAHEAVLGRGERRVDPVTLYSCEARSHALGREGRRGDPVTLYSCEGQSHALGRAERTVDPVTLYSCEGQSHATLLGIQREKNAPSTKHHRVNTSCVWQNMLLIRSVDGCSALHIIVSMPSLM